jgi:hypothetical protein
MIYIVRKFMPIYNENKFIPSFPRDLLQENNLAILNTKYLLPTRKVKNMTTDNCITVKHFFQLL